jgi:hypothetical protein
MGIRTDEQYLPYTRQFQLLVCKQRMRLLTLKYPMCHFYPKKVGYVN